jgi:hypothetical protein
VKFLDQGGPGRHGVGVAQVDARDTGADGDPLGTIQQGERERQVVAGALREETRKTSGFRLLGQRNDVSPSPGPVVGKEVWLLDQRDPPRCRSQPGVGSVRGLGPRDNRFCRAAHLDPDSIRNGHAKEAPKAGAPETRRGDHEDHAAVSDTRVSRTVFRTRDSLSCHSSPPKGRVGRGCCASAPRVRPRR